jgi:hypothetical protein
MYESTNAKSDCVDEFAVRMPEIGYPTAMFSGSFTVPRFKFLEINPTLLRWTSN